MSLDAKNVTDVVRETDSSINTFSHVGLDCHHRLKEYIVLFHTWCDQGPIVTWESLLFTITLTQGGKYEFVD